MADEVKELRRERDALAKRLDIVDLPSGSPSDGGWVSSSRTRQRIGAVVDRIGGPGLDDEVLDAVAEMIEQAERERDEARAKLDTVVCWYCARGDLPFDDDGDFKHFQPGDDQIDHAVRCGNEAEWRRKAATDE